MHILVAGAGGVVGMCLVPLLVSNGHEVVATTRSPEKAERLRQAGAQPVHMDALNPESVMAAVRLARPDVVVHELTDLSGMSNPRTFDRDFESTNRLRTEGTDHLIAAARAAGASRLVAQSFAGWPYARSGSTVKTEADPLDPNPPTALRRALAAIRHLEAAVQAADGLQGIVLRYGSLYGPGTSLGEGGVYVEQVRAGRFPIVGRGTGVWSFLHVHDAATATAAAIERGAPGVYNIVDDDPAPVSDWLPGLTSAVGAKPPSHVPAWLARLLLGEAGVVLMTDVRGASNAKAKRDLGWQPKYASWRRGFAEGLGTAADDMRRARRGKSRT